MKRPFFFRRNSQFSSLLPLYTMSKDELYQELETYQIQAKRNVNKADPAQLINEIEIHQLELEIQNRELMDSQKLLENSVAKYQDLYNSAPVSFFTLNEKGRFLQINTTGAVFFESEIKDILGEPLNSFVAKDSRPALANFLSRCLEAKPFQKNDCELLLEIP